jgi:transcriptional regulator with XRE-family HTH domain
LNRNNQIVPTDLTEFSVADTIEETLSFYHITQAEFARRNRISEKHLSQVLHRKAFISLTVALSIEEVTGIPAYMLPANDTRYRLAHTNKPMPSDKANDSDFLKQYDWAMA